MKNLLAILALSCGAALAQAPAFEVAVVKPVNQADFLAAARAGQRPNTSVNITSTRVNMGYQSLFDLIFSAYDVVPVQIVGPDFLKTEHYDIQATMPVGATEAQVPKMLQALLAERFKLTVHKEKREVPIYALIVGKSGLRKMKPATTEEIAPEPMPGDVTQNTPFGKMTRRETKNGMVAFIAGLGTLKISMGGSGEHIEFSNLTTSRFVQLLSSEGDRMVVDKTGLKGSYEASFDISMDQGPQQAPGGGAEGGAAIAATPQQNPIFGAVEQMGLKLDTQKDQVEMLIVDHVEKTPTDN